MKTEHAAVPMYFGTPDRPLFGWLHPPRAPARDCGVVVCNPIGDDAVRAHRVLRHLAERLARAGFFVVRFDFDGTGDSTGDEADADRVAAWIGDVGRAIDELRAKSRVAKVALAGLRLGATLAAAAAAERGDVDDLILFSPYADGVGFVTHVTRMHQVHRMLEPHSFAIDPKGFDPGGQEALGFVLTTPTIAALKRIDLTVLARRPAARALLLGAGAVAETRVAERLRALGCVVDEKSGADDRFLITIAHKATLPERELDVMVRWLGDAHPARLPAVERGGVGAGAAIALGSPAFREQPLFIRGASTPLFGILTVPADRARAERRPGIILFNAGTVHRIGPHRLYVRMARGWAERGFYVLRVDLPGIGDSPVPAGCDENLCYPRDAIADAQAAMTALGVRARVDRFVLAGLCSGGDITFQTARVDERVTTAVIMNPRTFLINDLALVEGYKPPAYYFETLFDRRKLVRLATGGVDVRRAVSSLCTNLAGAGRRWRESRAAADASEDVPTSLRRLAERGVDTLLVVAAHDPGVEYVDRHFAPGMRALAAVDGFRRIDIDGTDHTFTSVYAQRFVTEMLTRHLLERHPS